MQEPSFYYFDIASRIGLSHNGDNGSDQISSNVQVERVKSLITSSSEQTIFNLKAAQDDFIEAQKSNPIELDANEVAEKMQRLRYFADHLDQVTRNYHYLMAKANEPVISNHISLHRSKHKLSYPPHSFSHYSPTIHSFYLQFCLFI
ncbi:hypothetical protein AYI70_g2022 [Smittium culicis]|uniref:Uncharacterized protein n=1 Tax=Smittium culicis TaxID=133412 RepID=A0A1R1YAC2_9FUNG|nr:hypothetical protein AYI70_g2022 [Smittium culicis]